MRRQFCRALVDRAADERFVFLTGDLGYDALEPLRDAIGSRFINAGIAEQNMVSVAAGLARNGLRPWVYSIAAFVYTRPFEQIRVDVCLHDLPVRIVGNGGGYGYGVMGCTHHALEDYGALLTLQNMRVFVPAFNSDVEAVVGLLQSSDHPAYLRLGLGEEPKGYEVPEYAQWRRLVAGDGPTVLAVGPIAGGLIAPFQELPPSHRPNMWVITELPLGDPPASFIHDVQKSGRLVVVEEHVAQGSVGQMIARHLLLSGQPPVRFSHLSAAGYPSGKYGSQKFHRKECGIDAESVVALLKSEPVSDNAAATI